MEVRQAVLDLGGARYYYRLLARRARPHFVLAPARGREYPAVRGPDRVVAAQGSTVKIPVTVRWLEGLEGMGADIQLTIEGLPPEIQVPPIWARVAEGKHSGKSAAFTAQVELPLAVPADASLGTYPIRVRGEAVVGETPLRGGRTDSGFSRRALRDGFQRRIPLHARPPLPVGRQAPCVHVAP